MNWPAFRLTEPPVDIGREQAAEEAGRELSKAVYHQDFNLLERFFRWLSRLFDDAINQAGNLSPSARVGGFLAIAAVVGLLALVLWRAGGIQRNRRGRGHGRVFDSDGAARSAADYRALAEQLAGVGRLAEAVRARFRACVAELTERTILDERTGRTASEAAWEAGAAIASLATPMRAAAEVFNDVIYGNRAGTPQRYAVVVEADEQARRARLRQLSQAAAGDVG